MVTAGPVPEAGDSGLVNHRGYKHLRPVGTRCGGVQIPAGPPWLRHHLGLLFGASGVAGQFSNWSTLIFSFVF